MTPGRKKRSKWEQFLLAPEAFYWEGDSEWMSFLSRTACKELDSDM